MNEKSPSLCFYISTLTSGPATPTSRPGSGPKGSIGSSTLAELRALVAERGGRATHSPSATVNWYCDRVKQVEPPPLGMQRCRDADDDPYLACALAAGAKVMATRDGDLLSLQQPFGIRIITPRELLSLLARPLP